MSLQDFFESTQGKVIIVVVMVVLLLLLLIPSKKRRQAKRVDVKSMTISAAMVALSMILSMITLFRMPYGGFVTPMSMLPIAIIAYFYGTRQGVTAGVVLGLLNLVMDPYVIHPVQMLLDYPLAFGALGIGGFAGKGKYGLHKVYIIGIIGRYICSVLSGVIFFGSNAPEGFNALTYSLFYNITYIGIEGIITLLIISIPAVRNAIESAKKNA
ncbi:MAG: energy-coupled thiamine transporter ThiT [Eubacterium sp.]|jgi:thiamine transporter